MLKEIDGDLIEGFKKGDYNVIAHGCNCYATMGAGIALTIGNEFPIAKKADREFKIPNGHLRLGKYSLCRTKHGYIYNLYSQFMPGPDFRMFYFKKSIKAMVKSIDNLFPNKDAKIGLPLIGCGIGGADWQEVKKVIEEVFEGYDVTIVHFKSLVVGVNYFPKSYVKEKRRFKKPF